MLVRVVSNHHIFLFLFFSLIGEAICQPQAPSVLPTFETAPRSVSRSPIKLADYLTQQDSSEIQQVLNIYTWITNNIKYDVKADRKIKSKSYSPQQTLRRKRGLCYQYSELFVALCQNAGISAKTINGYSKGFSYHEEDEFYESDHAWNGVKLDSTWYLVDVTWGSGNLQQKRRWLKELFFKWFKKPYINDRYKFIKEPNYDYFLIAPEALLINHLPSDPNWQLVDYPISLSTFESSEWKIYKSSMDSSYNRNVDSIDYVKKLNTYEFLSEKQYRRIEAANSNEFNSKNLKQLGFSTIEVANSLEQKTGSIESQLSANLEAVKLYRTGVRQLQQHQKSARSVSERIIKKSQSRIQHELKKPITSRKKVATQNQKQVVRFFDKYEKSMQAQVNRINKLNYGISKGFRSYSKPQSARTKKDKIVERNINKIEANLHSIKMNEDSISRLTVSLKNAIKQKNSYQDSIIMEYKKLLPLVELNTSSIVQNEGISNLSQSMSLVKVVGESIDAFAAERLTFDREIRQLKGSLKQLSASVISASSEVQKLVIQNCQLSLNKVCEHRVCNECRDKIESMQHSKLSHEKMYMSSLKKDLQYFKSLNQLVPPLQKAMTNNANFVAHFEQRRIAGIRFKQARSNHETSELIKYSNDRIRRLASRISDLKIQARKNH